MKHLILYAEDDPELAGFYKEDLEAAGYEVVWAKDGKKALSLYKELVPDLILLDIKMPKMDGYEVAREIRGNDLYTPIIFLTSLHDSKDAVRGLKLGADDYIRKGSDMKERLARIKKAILKNPVKRERFINITPDTKLDTENRILCSYGRSENLSFRDCDLLRILLLKKNMLLKRDMLMEHVWHDREDTENLTKQLNKSISKLRKALSADEHIQLIADRGVGVTLKVDPTFKQRKSD